MEEALQHETTTQRIGLSPASPGNHPSDGPKTGDALTFKMDHSSGADQWPLRAASAPVHREVDRAPWRSQDRLIPDRPLPCWRTGWNEPGPSARPSLSLSSLVSTSFPGR